LVGVVAFLWGQCCALSGSAAQDGFVPQKHHAWARFEKGAWKRVRVVAETLDETGELVGTSTTETTTTLQAVSDKGVELLIESSVEIGSKRYDVQPRTVRLGFLGQVNGQTATVTDMGAGSVTISGKKIPCQTRRITIQGDSSKRISIVHFNDRVAPYELARETKSVDLEEETPKYQTEVRVLAVNMPHKVLADIMTAAFVKTIHTTPKGKTIALETHCPKIPGAVVAHSSKELDLAGRIISRSTLELVDYGLAPRVAPEE